MPTPSSPPNFPALGIDRCGGAAALAKLYHAFGLAHSAPDAVGLGGLQSMLAAHFNDWARVADCLRAVFALGAGAAALAIWVIKYVRVFSAAGAL